MWRCGSVAFSPSQDGTDDLEDGGQYRTMCLCLLVSQLVHVFNPIVFLLLTLTEKWLKEEVSQGPQTKWGSLKTATGNTVCADYRMPSIPTYTCSPPFGNSLVPSLFIPFQLLFKGESL